MKPPTNPISDPDLNRKIAEAIGVDTSGLDICQCGVEIYGYHDNHSPVPMACPNDLYPLFSTSLDAMAEAEKMLTDDEHWHFRDELEKLTYDPNKTISANWRAVVSASARQRAEAWARVKGLI